MRTILVYDYDSILVISNVKNTLVYLRTILVGFVILIVSWTVENNLIYLRTKSSLHSIIFLTNSVLSDLLGPEIKNIRRMFKTQNFQYVDLSPTGV